jgi:hypothetical protein
VLIYYARLARIPLEFIVDDDIGLDYFKLCLTWVDRKRGELNQPQDPEEHRMVLFWRTSNTSDPKHDDKLPCPAVVALWKRTPCRDVMCAMTANTSGKGGKFWTASFESLPENCLSCPQRQRIGTSRAGL